MKTIALLIWIITPTGNQLLGPAVYFDTLAACTAAADRGHHTADQSTVCGGDPGS